jgi:hypothetical protein
MSKQYNLSTTEDNGQSVTTSQTVTEHPEEILRLMKLAGLENAQVVAEDEAVFEPTEANDKLDLDDYSKKSPESIAKQKKSIQPTLGDNPLEYSLDENEIYEAMIEEFDKTEEVTEELTAGQKKLPDALQKSILAKQDKKESTEESTEEKVEEDGAAISTAIKKHKNRKRNYNDDGIAPPSGHHNNTSNRWAESTEEEIEENLKEADEEIKKLKEGCGCGHGSDCNCGPECDCGCNAVTEAVEEVVETEVAVADEDQSRLKDLINYQN